MNRFHATILSIGLILPIPVHAQEMSLEQVIQRVVDHYPSFKIAAIQVERALQSSKAIDSQLGWQLDAQAGYAEDMTIFGTPSDAVDVAGSVSRKLESGSTLSIGASARREDSQGAFSPVIPNPSTSTNLDVTFRKPLAKGSDNSSYTEGLAAAKAEVAASNAESKALYDQIATQIIDLYSSAATIETRIHNTERAITRTQRLKGFINKQASLGVSEDKDLLQVDAQLNSLRADLVALQTLWQKQLISLNRLMGRKWSEPLKTSPLTDSDKTLLDFSAIIKDVMANSPDIASADARIELADSAIRKRRDDRENNLDLVLFLGNKTQEGDTATGNLDASEVVGGIRIEFSESFDKSGVDAELYQAQLDRSAALQDKRQIVEDLEYALSSLLAEIKSNREAIKAYQRSVNSEKEKMNDALKRYEIGRTDTDQLIQFEDQLSQAEFSLELQRIELVKRQGSLRLLQGTLWKNINIPHYNDFIESNGNEK